MVDVSFDLRGMPVWERAETVLDRARQLHSGDSFQFTMEFEPRALVTRVEQESGIVHCRWQRVGEHEWHVTVTRPVESPGASPLTTALRRSVFREVSPDALAMLAESMSERTARRNEVICDENTACEWLGVVLEGGLEIFAAGGGRNQLLFDLFPYDVFGAGEFFDEGLRVGRTIAVSKIARYAAIPYDVVRDAGRRDPRVLLALGMCNAQRMRVLVSRLSAQVSKPILVRVAGALLPYAVPARGMQPALSPMPSMTQTQIAAAAGTVKEVAARAIAELERAGAVRRERGHVRFLDRSKLLEAMDAG